MKKFLTILILLAATCCAGVPSAFAQGVLKGRVVSSDGEALEYVTVGAFSAPQGADSAMRLVAGTITDAKGRYQLDVPTADSVSIRFSFTGYAPKQFALALKKGEHRTLNCTLLPDAVNLPAADIVDEKTRTTTFTQIEIQKLEAAVGPNTGVESLLKTLPDVNSNNELSSQYSVRGGSFDENLVYINDVEVYRPSLIRSGEQEGMSIINTDLVDHILFSPGGFEASYGDKMSSVLDIDYRRPAQNNVKLSASFLGATAFAEGLVGQRFSYAVGFRQHSNRYLFRSMDTHGDYTTNYTDLQAILTYRASDKLDISFLGMATRNVYELIPTNRKTVWGNMMESLELDIYFDGQEMDRYRTLLGAVTLDYRPNPQTQIKWITSAQQLVEREIYDIQSQYMLYECNVGDISEDDSNKIDRGIGTFLEHARNSLTTRIFSTQVKGTRFARMGNWNWGAKLQYEQISDNIREWKWVDSAGYSLPTSAELPGLPTNGPVNPILQLYCNSHHQVGTARATAFVQRSFDYYTDGGDLFSLVAGVRGHYYYAHTLDADPQQASQFLASPRLSLNYKPKWERDMLFRLAAGGYAQPPFYREYRFDNGDLNLANIRAQRSYQTAATFDWNLRLWNKPFTLTADVYYKYLTDLIPYRIDNLRIHYDAQNSAVGYARGISVRLYGEFVEGLESWASLSFMKTQEDVLGDDYGWIDRPTDQRFSFKLFFQDYIPTIPCWRMSLNLIASTGLPFTDPNDPLHRLQYRLPAYYRIDWGNTIQLKKLPKLQNARLFRVVDDVLLSAEVFNLFDYQNTVSYLPVADYDNHYYGVPNYLTGRQLNLKLTVTF